MSDKIIKTFPEDAKYPEDILFTIEIIPAEAIVDFTIYKPTFVSKANGDREPDEEYINGCVKWDGCSNWSFEYSPFHACSREELVNIGLVLAKCWDWAGEYGENFYDWVPSPDDKKDLDPPGTTCYILSKAVSSKET